MATPRVAPALLAMLSVGSTAWADEEDGIEVRVTATRHLAEFNRTATRSDADPMTLPLSVSTLSPELLEQQGVRSLAEALNNVSGIQDRGTSGNLAVRGFTAGVLKNGSFDATSLTAYGPPLIGIERIEVIKGPEAIIAGQSAGYGGVVNVITKLPQAKRLAEATVQLGEHGRYEVGLDLAGALSEDKRFTGRLVAATGAEGKDALGYAGNRQDYLAPSLGYRDRSTGTEAVLSYERNEQALKNFWSVYFDPATQKLDQSLKPIRLGDNDRRAAEGTTENLALDVSQRLTDAWRVSLKLMHQDLRHQLAGGTIGLVAAYPNVLGLEMVADTAAKKDVLKIDLNGEFATGPLQHNLLLAFDNERSKLHQSQPSPFKTSLYSATDGRLIANLRPAGPPTVVADQAPRETGVLLLDHVSWGQWVALLGVRRIGYEPGDKRSTADEQYTATLPTLGIVYRQTEALSLYASAAEGFQANTGKREFATGQQVKPEQAQQYELGFKQLLRDRQLALSAALYRIEQKNYAAIDTVNSVFPLQYYRNVPGVTSRGFDAELSGQLTDRLAIRAAYNHGDVDTPDGQTPVSFARQIYSLSLSYAFSGAAQGAWLGGGVQGRDAVKNFDAVLGRNITSPAALRIDLYGGYRAKDWSFIAGVKNITDRQNYTLESGPNGVGFIVQPREAYLTAHLRF